MFDVSFSELVLILIVGLLVFGPEKLPEVVRTTGLWIGKLRRSFNNIRSEIEREVGVEELKRDLHNQSIMDSLKGVQDDLRGAQRDLQQIPYEMRNSIDNHTSAPVQTYTQAPATTAVDPPIQVDTPLPVDPHPETRAPQSPAVDPLTQNTPPHPQQHRSS